MSSDEVFKIMKMQKIKIVIAELFVCYSFFCASLYGEDELLKSYQAFLKLNESYTTIKETMLLKQSIVKHGDTEKSKESAYCLFHKNGQCVQIKKKNKIQYFFSSTLGYWLYTSKLKTPLKISGAYKLEEFEIQDILKTDFENEYRIAECKDGDLILERKTSKSPYKFIFFKMQEENTYSLTFADGRKTPTRRLTYHKGVVDGYPCFEKIDVYNLKFNTSEVSSWITESAKKVAVPSSFFSYSKIKQLTEQMEHILKEENKN